MKDYSRINKNVSRLKRRQSKGHISFLPKVIAGFIFLSLLWLLIGPYGLIRLYKLDNERKQLLVASKQMEDTNLVLKEDVNRFKTDETFRERTVRRKLGWLKDDERIYKFMKD